MMLKDRDSTVVDSIGEVAFHGGHETVVHRQTLSRRHLDDVRERFPFLRECEQFVLM